MPAVKYDVIYRSLRKAIEYRKYPYGSVLPSEHQLIQEYECSRNTVRRAIGKLAEEGYVQSVQGKGVLVIYQRHGETQFMISGIESLKEAAARNGMTLETKVILFEERTVDEALSEETGFPAGSEIYYVQRVRFLDGKARILDHNYFLKSVVHGLTPEIASGSIYEYVEGVLGETIVTTRRRYMVELETELDRQYLDMGEYNCLMVVSSRTFNKEGVMFEYTSSRHHPKHFAFCDQAQRRK